MILCNFAQNAISLSDAIQFDAMRWRARQSEHASMALAEQPHRWGTPSAKSKWVSRNGEIAMCAQSVQTIESIFAFLPIFFLIANLLHDITSELRERSLRRMLAWLDGADARTHNFISLSISLRD